MFGDLWSYFKLRFQSKSHNLSLLDKLSTGPKSNALIPLSHEFIQTRACSKGAVNSNIPVRNWTKRLYLTASLTFFLFFSFPLPKNHELYSFAQLEVE